MKKKNPHLVSKTYLFFHRVELTSFTTALIADSIQNKRKKSNISFFLNFSLW